MIRLRLKPEVFALIKADADAAKCSPIGFIARIIEDYYRRRTEQHDEG